MGECARRFASFLGVLLHSQGWTPRNGALLEAVFKRVKASRHPSAVACDANMNTEDFEKNVGFQCRQMFTEAPKEASTCKSKGPKGELIERTYDYVNASRSLRGKITQMEVWKISSQGHAKQCLL